jgi:Tol biopolymer transport system component
MRAISSRQEAGSLGDVVFSLRLVFRTAVLFTILCASLAAASAAVGHLKLDGQQIVYITQGRGIQRIYAFDMEAQLTIQMSHEAFGYCCGPVVWSPDRKQLVVTYTPNTLHTEFYIVTLNGRFQRSLSDWNELTSIDTLAWSPDGRYLAFEIRGTSSTSIYRTDVNSAEETVSLTDSRAINFGAAWSPDGQQIAFSSLLETGSAIFVMDADGGNPRQINPDIASFHEPSWSPDGQQIAFLRNVGVAWDVLVMNSDGSDLRQVTHGAQVASSLLWSPDGQRLAYIGMVDNNEELFVLNLSDGVQRRLTDTATREYAPVWSPDGQRIMFTSRDDNNYDISVISADGSDYRRVIDTPERDFAPVWLQFGDW